MPNCPTAIPVCATQEKMDGERDSTGIFMAGIWATVCASWFDSEAPPEPRHGIATAAASMLRSDTQRTHPDAQIWPGKALRSWPGSPFPLAWGPGLPSYVGKDTPKSHEATKTSVAQAKF